MVAFYQGVGLSTLAAVAVLASPVSALPSKQNPHGYKGYGFDNPGASAWEKRHGIRPNGGGFVYDGSSAQQTQQLEDTALERHERQQFCTKLRGLFIRECESAGTDSNGDPMSTTDTRYYDAQGGYELDRTYYVGDKDCTPNDSDIYYKLNLHGSITYHGIGYPQVQLNSKNWGTVCQAEMTWGATSIILGDNSRGKYMAQTIADNCPCGGNWVAPGNITTFPRNCDAAANASQVYICKLITGGSDYFNYAWDTDYQQYATSADGFGSTQNYYNKVGIGYTRELITESMNHDPDDCIDRLRNDPCHPAAGSGISPGCGCLEEAQTACHSCIGLECDGCLLRELDPSFNPAADNNIWHKCCPCIYAYEESQDRNWVAALGRC